MKLRAFVAAAALLVGMACAYSVSVGKEEAAKADASQLIGTWKLVSAKYGGQEAGFPVGMTMLKHVTPEQFMWARYDADGQVLAAAGGTYEIKGEAYAELPKYGLGADFDGIKGKSHPFTWKVEGRKWHHRGKLAEGLTIDDVWERVDKQ